MFPYEIYLHILKYVPYETLYRSVRLVNHQLSNITCEVIEKYDLGIILFFIAYEDGKHVASWHSCYKRLWELKYRSIPQCDPPAFIKFRRLCIDGKITHELIKFLHKIKKFINECKIDFEELETFSSEVERSKITLNTFFDSLPTRCTKIWIDQISCFISNEFFVSPYVLNCNSLYIKTFIDIDYELVFNWLFFKSEMRRELFIMQSCNGVNKLLNCIHKNAFDNPNFDANFDIFFHSKVSEGECEQFVIKNKLGFHRYNESSVVFYTINGYEQRLKNDLSKENMYNYTIIDVRVGN